MMGKGQQYRQGGGALQLHTQATPLRGLPLAPMLCRRHPGPHPGLAALGLGLAAQALP